MSRAGLAALALGKEAVMSLYASAMNATRDAMQKEEVWEAMAFGDRPAPPPIRPQDYLAILCVCAATFLTLTFPVTTALLPVVRLAFRLWARGSGRHRPVPPAIELLVSVAVATCLGRSSRARARNACVKAARKVATVGAWVLRCVRRAVARGAQRVHRCAGFLLDATAPFVHALDVPTDEDDEDVDHDGGSSWEDEEDDDEAEEYRGDDNEFGNDYDDETLVYDDDDADEDDDTGTEHDDDARSSSEDERSDIVRQGLLQWYQIVTSTEGAGGQEQGTEEAQKPPEGNHDDDDNEPPPEGGGGGNDSVLEIADSDDEA